MMNLAVKTEPPLHRRNNNEFDKIWQNGRNYGQRDTPDTNITVGDGTLGLPTGLDSPQRMRNRVQSIRGS